MSGGGDDTNFGDNRFGDGDGGDDKIKSGDGDDTSSGGTGADKFNCGKGTDTVTDFNEAEEQTKTVRMSANLFFFFS